jgi:RNA polymerase sigma factor (sigma-70 family)
MRERQLDRLFERFRNRGDVDALAKVFDATAGELFRVAVHLTRDLHAAEDLVQETFLAAIEARTSYDEARRLLPWLLGILANKVAQERRRRARQIEALRFEPTLVPGPLEVAASKELSAELTRAIEALPSLYREPLIAHLRHGKTAQEIAVELHRAPGTVRVQLHRGLEMLRKLLPAGLATGSALAAGSSPGLSATRAAVVRSAQEAAALTIGNATAATAGGLIGGVTVSARVWILIAGALLTIGWLGMHMQWTGTQDGVASVVEPSRTPLSAVESTSVPPVSEALAEPEVPSQRKPIEAAQRPVVRAEAAVSGRLLLPSEAPAVGAYVALMSMVAGAPQVAVTEASTESDGSFRLSADPGSFLLVALAEGVLPLTREVTLAPEKEQRLEPAIFPLAASIRGRVRIAGEAPPLNTGVEALFQGQAKEVNINGRSLLWLDQQLFVRFGRAQTDADGRFVIDGLEPQIHQVSVTDSPEARVLRAAQEIQAPADNVWLDFDLAHLVILVQSEGNPLEANIALVEQSAEPASNRLPHLLRRTGDRWGFGGLRSTAEAFVLPGSTFELQVEREGYQRLSRSVVAPPAGERIELTVDLKAQPNTAELECDVVASDGSPIDHAGFAFFGGSRGPRRQLADHSSGDGWI